MTLAQKLYDLHYCIAQGHNEDTCGHLCDLLAHFGKKITPSNPNVPKATTPVQLASRYGRNPITLTEERDR